jgi:hypothetical protein
LPYGAELGVSQVRTLINSISPINKKTAQENRGLFTSLSASNVGHVSVDFDNLHKENGKYFFSAIKTGEAPEVLRNQAFEVRMGFQGVSFSDQLSLFRGIVIDDPLFGPTFKVSADAISSTLYDIYEVPKSGTYSAPANDNTALPLLFGDLSENTGAQGVFVCPQLTATVWGLAAHAIQTEGGGNTITLYDDDGLISSSDYTITTSGDFESHGTIAYITFSVTPAGTVTATVTGGAVDGSDNVLTNPVDVIEKMLEIMGDDTALEATSKAEAKQTADDQGYTCAGIIIADQPKAFWLADITASFLGSWFLNEQDELVLQFDTATTDFTATADDLKQSFVISEPALLPSRDNTITRPIINYAFSAAQVDRRYRNDALTNYLKTFSNDEVAGDISQELFFNWTRNTATVESINDRIIELYGDGIKLYSWKTNDFSLVHLEPGDFVSFSNDWEYDSDGNPLKNQVGKVYNVTLDLMSQTVTLDFYDTGNYLLASPALWDGSRYVGDGLPYGGQRAA